MGAEWLTAVSCDVESPRASVRNLILLAEDDFVTRELKWRSCVDTSIKYASEDGGRLQDNTSSLLVRLYIKERW